MADDSGGPDFDIGSGGSGGDGIDPPAVFGSALRIAVVLLVITAPVVGYLAYEQVGEGYVGVQREWGAVTGVTYDPGAHWMVPVMQTVQPVEIRPRTYTMSDTQGEGQMEGRQDAVVVQTINGTTVRVDVTIRYRVVPGKAAGFVEQWNSVDQVEQRLIRPTVRSELRDKAAALYTTEIYTARGRQQLAEAARAALRGEFGDEAVELEAVQIREVDLPESLDRALNEKEVAKQAVQRKEFEIQQERKEAERKKISAEADAEVIEIRGRALRENPIVLRRQYIEALDRTDTVYVPMGDGGMPTFLSIDATASGGGENVTAGSNATRTAP